MSRGNKSIREGQPRYIGVTSQRYQPGSEREAVLLGEVLQGVINKRISARYERAEQLQQAWTQVLPPALTVHCRLDEFAGGVLKVMVDAPGYMHELRLCKKDLCDEINRMVPGAKIRDIRLVIGS